jgi:predicted hydrocarbon binding protein
MLDPALKETWLLRTEEGDRLLAIRTVAFNQIRNDLIVMLGEPVARQILYRVGISIAKSSFRSAMERKKIRNEEDFWRVVNELFQLRGWGRIVSHEETVLEAPSTNLFEIAFEDSAFTDPSSMQANPPVCDLLRGVLGGYVATFRKRALLSAIESSCKAMGTKNCVFRIQLGPLSVAAEFAKAFGTRG